MAMTGFDPRVGIDMFPLLPTRAMQDWTATHPGGATRFHALEGHMASAMEAHARRGFDLDRVSFKRDVFAAWMRELPSLRGGKILTMAQPEAEAGPAGPST